jgi:hypothetical protein
MAAITAMKNNKLSTTFMISNPPNLVQFDVYLLQQR